MTATGGRRSALDRSEAVLLTGARGLAIAGGLVLIALVLVTVYSIVGRALPNLPGLGWWGPLRGDFELIETGTALAIFSFLPYAQMTRSHVLVDLLTSAAPRRIKAGLEVPAHLLLALLAGLISWRMIVATTALLTATYTQTTMLLGMPLWWGYLPSTACMAFLTITALFSAWRSLAEARRP